MRGNASALFHSPVVFHAALRGEDKCGFLTQPVNVFTVQMHPQLKMWTKITVSWYNETFCRLDHVHWLCFIISHERIHWYLPCLYYGFEQVAKVPERKIHSTCLLTTNDEDRDKPMNTSGYTSYTKFQKRLKFRRGKSTHSSRLLQKVVKVDVLTQFLCSSKAIKYSSEMYSKYKHKKYTLWKTFSTTISVQSYLSLTLK